MRTLVLDVWGEYAQFKKPYAPMSPVSFPFPPPTAVLGLLGAVAGFGKQEYADRLGWHAARIGVAIRSPLHTVRAALNLLNTKDGTDAHFRPKAGANTHIQVPFEFLKEPRFRIYAGGLDGRAMDRLAGFLRSGRTEYTPCLGLAQCIAEVAWVGEWEAEPIGDGEWSAETAVALTAGIAVEYQQGRRYHRFRVPAQMDGARIVHRYQEAVIAEDGGPVRGSGPGLYRVGDAIVSLL